MRRTSGLCPGIGGCPFAADPTLSALEAPVAWRADVCASLLPITAAPAEFGDAVTLEELAQRALAALDSGQLFLGEPGAAFQLVPVGDNPGGLALLLPLNGDLPTRLEVARQLWSWLSSTPALPPDRPTAQQCVRLVEQLRALDGRLDRASIRDIAVALFGDEVLASGRDWRTHDLRSRTRRLVDGGLKLMRGAYRTLLRRS